MKDFTDFKRDIGIAIFYKNPCHQFKSLNPRYLRAMLTEDLSNLIVEQLALASKELKRQVIVDFYLPKNIADPGGMSLLLINDGQNLEEMPFSKILNGLLESNQVRPLLCVGIHAGRDRKNEYGTAGIPDYEGRGAKAAAYEQFILEQLLPFIHTHYGVEKFQDIGFAGFSLGGLTAIDLAWKHPDIFSTAGVFSGSLWWRSKPLGKDYNDDTDRIMHQNIRNGSYHEGLRFYFTTGSKDETADRNGNGIIDSIDDTLDLVNELEKHGYNKETDIAYVNYEDGKHDIPTWGRAMPKFLIWGWGGEL
jgi:iron(III)-enterobactin esterase